MFGQTLMAWSSGLFHSHLQKKYLQLTFAVQAFLSCPSSPHLRQFRLGNWTCLSKLSSHTQFGARGRLREVEGVGEREREEQEDTDCERLEVLFAPCSLVEGSLLRFSGSLWAESLRLDWFLHPFRLLLLFLELFPVGVVDEEVEVELAGVFGRLDFFTVSSSGLAKVGCFSSAAKRSWRGLTCGIL